MTTPDDSIALTRMAAGYDGRPQRLHVLAHHAEYHQRPGVFLIRAEAELRAVHELSPDEAEALGRLLTEAAAESRAAFGAGGRSEHQTE
jgi:diadenosine tetraphosphate (Ap4A) HIT family hydrolase